MHIKKTIIELGFRLQYQGVRLALGRRDRRLAPPADGWPVLLGISFPKSGTNLLRQVLAAFSRVAPFADRSFDVFAAFDAETGEPRTSQDALRFLDALRPGDIAAAHFHAWSEVVERICTPRYLPFFIYRDPRDVVVSHVFYVTKMAPEHAHHLYYTEVLKTFDERLTTSILGRPDSPTNFPDIRQRFQPYLGWLDRPEVLSLRYEDFIQDCRAALEKVLSHFTRRVPLSISNERMLAWLEESIVPEKSPTFRSGKTGEWRRYFTEEHRRLFKQVSGNMLADLGYESGDAW